MLPPDRATTSKPRPGARSAKRPIAQESAKQAVFLLAEAEIGDAQPVADFAGDLPQASGHARGSGLLGLGGRWAEREEDGDDQ